MSSIGILFLRSRVAMCEQTGVAAQRFATICFWLCASVSKSKTVANEAHVLS